jgi:hypothetical protein
MRVIEAILFDFLNGVAFFFFGGEVEFVFSSIRDCVNFTLNNLKNGALEPR